MHRSQIKPIFKIPSLFSTNLCKTIGEVEYRRVELVISLSQFEPDFSIETTNQTSPKHSSRRRPRRHLATSCCCYCRRRPVILANRQLFVCLFALLDLFFSVLCFVL
ncbi:hypothetical protein LWI28_002381 [Acer negundo]|uniref:Uncharacterized protein n=1 Tax=Acer negundo TaxID=4023 RepID=A0AAD5JS94_ACENE|nr:hypothetical protein LWI28_002381 [Acer negundo]